MPAAVPKFMGGASVLMSMQGAEVVRKIPLAPLSTMAVSVMGRLIFLVLGLWGWGLQCKK